MFKRILVLYTHELDRNLYIIGERLSNPNAMVQKLHDPWPIVININEILWVKPHSNHTGWFVISFRGFVHTNWQLLKDLLAIECTWEELQDLLVPKGTFIGSPQDFGYGQG